MQCRHAPWEPHTNRGEIFFCILLYLNISDFSWLKVLLSSTLCNKDIKPPSHIKISKQLDKKPYSHLEWPTLESNLARTSIPEPTEMTIIISAVTQDPTNTGKILTKILRVDTGMAFYWHI